MAGFGNHRLTRERLTIPGSSGIVLGTGSRSSIGQQGPKGCAAESLNEPIQQRHDGDVSGGCDESAEREPGEDITRVVSADVDACEGHEDGSDAGDDTPAPVREEQSHRDGPDRGGMVAREREVGCLADEKMDTGHRVVWSGTIDRTADNLSQTECDQSGTAGPDAAGKCSKVVVVPGVKVRDHQQDDKQHDPISRVAGEESMRPTGAVGESVDPEEQRAIH